MQHGMWCTCCLCEAPWSVQPLRRQEARWLQERCQHPTSASTYLEKGRDHCCTITCKHPDRVQCDVLGHSKGVACRRQDALSLHCCARMLQHRHCSAHGHGMQGMHAAPLAAKVQPGGSMHAASHAAVTLLLTANHRCNMRPMSVAVLAAVCAVDSVKGMEGACSLCDGVDKFFMRRPVQPATKETGHSRCKMAANPTHSGIAAIEHHDMSVDTMNNTPALTASYRSVVSGPSQSWNVQVLIKKQRTANSPTYLMPVSKMYTCTPVPAYSQVWPLSKRAVGGTRNKCAEPLLSLRSAYHCWPSLKHMLGRKACCLQAGFQPHHWIKKHQDQD